MGAHSCRSGHKTYTSPQNLYFTWSKFMNTPLPPEHSMQCTTFHVVSVEFHYQQFSITFNGFCERGWKYRGTCLFHNTTSSVRNPLVVLYQQNYFQDNHLWAIHYNYLRYHFQHFKSIQITMHLYELCVTVLRKKSDLNPVCKVTSSNLCVVWVVYTHCRATKMKYDNKWNHETKLTYLVYQLSIAPPYMSLTQTRVGSVGQR